MCRLTRMRLDLMDAMERLSSVQNFIALNEEYNPVLNDISGITSSETVDKRHSEASVTAVPPSPRKRARAAVRTFRADIGCLSTLIDDKTVC